MLRRFIGGGTLAVLGTLSVVRLPAQGRVPAGDWVTYNRSPRFLRVLTPILEGSVKMSPGLGILGFASPSVYPVTSVASNSPKRFSISPG
jgi:hypothetical protein